MPPELTSTKSILIPEQANRKASDLKMSILERNLKRFTIKMPTALDPTKEIPTVEDVSLEDIDREQNFQKFGGQVKDFDPESPLEPRLLEDIENAIERDNDDFAFPNLD